MIRSPLRYPGGKYKALPQIMPLVPEDIEDLREPFFGGGSFTIGYLQSNRKKPKRVTVGDFNPEIWAFWTGVQKSSQTVANIAKEWFTRIPDQNELWSNLKNIDCSTLSVEERSARMFLINRVSFSGMGDSGTLSKDQYAEFKLEHTNRILEISTVLQGVDIRNCSYEEIMFENGNNVFIFLDPPYLTQEKSKLYGKDGNMHAGFPHQKFADDCRICKHDWLVTYDDSPRVRRLFKGLHIKPFKIPYTMAGKTSDDALAGEELFISNYSLDNELEYEDLKSMI